MKNIVWLAVGGLALFSVACGDDDDGGGCDNVADGTCPPGCPTDPDCMGGGDDSGTGDAGTDDSGAEDSSTPPMPPVCPTGDEIPDEDGLMGACCYRVSNSDRMDAPEFRVSSLLIRSPQSLGNPIVRGALNKALDEERFNWLLSASIDGSNIAVTTGFGQRSDGGTFAFTMDAAPMPGSADRWNPITAMGTLTGETAATPALDMPFTVPIFGEPDMDGNMELAIELPLNGFELISATFSEDRSCIGLRSGTTYDTTQGEIRTYVTIRDAMMGRVEIDPFNTSLCNFIAGMGTNEGLCTDVDQSEWPVRPDSVCNNGVCSGDCDEATTCNAWAITGQFAAHGVEITN